MQCVILAAGEGKRMRPLTDECPKPLVSLLGRPLLDHITDALPSAITELIIVVGYRADQIRAHCGSEYRGRRVTYVEQNKPKGTANALFLARPRIKGRFLILFADDVHGADDLAAALKHDLSVLAHEHEHPERFGVISLHENGLLKDIVEKPEKPETNLVSTGVMVLDERIFNYRTEAAPNGEYYIPPLLKALAADAPVAVVRQRLWLPIGYPEDIKKAELLLGSM